MAIDWKPEAIEAFKKELDGWSGNFDEALRAALDAAVEAQESLVDIGEDLNHTRSYKRGRASAFEEAAALLEHEARQSGAHVAPALEHAAVAIRALTKEPK